VLGALLPMIDPATDWKRRLVALIQRYPTVPLGQMGIPVGWDACAFWETRSLAAAPERPPPLIVSVGHSVVR